MEVNQQVTGAEFVEAMLQMISATDPMPDLIIVYTNYTESATAGGGLALFNVGTVGYLNMPCWAPTGEVVASLLERGVTAFILPNPAGVGHAYILKGMRYEEDSGLGEEPEPDGEPQ